LFYKEELTSVDFYVKNKTRTFAVDSLCRKKRLLEGNRLLMSDKR